MAKLIKFEVVELPKIYVIGKELRYSMDAHMKGDNRIGALWNQCFAEELFTTLEKQADFIFDPAYVGVMLDWGKGDGDFSYVCGMLFKEGASVPEGCVIKEIDATKAAVSWIQGKDINDICSQAHEMTQKKMREQNLPCDQTTWCMEFYNCPRYTTPDENGEIILDYYIPVQ